MGLVPLEAGVAHTGCLGLRLAHELAPNSVLHLKSTKSDKIRMNIHIISYKSEYNIKEMI